MGDSKAGHSSISVFFPAFNDAENLKTQIPRTVETLERLTADFEIIVVDDGSTDATPEVLDAFRRKYSFLRVVRHPHNLGYGAALQSGFNHATKELVFYTDGDGQYDVRDLPRLFEKLSPETDMVMGFKVRRADAAHRSMIGKLYQTGIKFLFGLKIQDVDCDFRLIRRRVLDAIVLSSQTGAICVDLMRQIERGGFRVVEVPVQHHPRLHGTSQFFRVGPVFWTLVDLGRLWVRLVLLQRRSPQGKARAVLGR